MFNLFKVIKKSFENNKLGFIGIIGIIFTIIFGGLTLYYMFYTPQPEISYTILSDSNVVDLHKPLEDLKILFQDEDIQKNNMNLKIYSLKISNSGKNNILETHYASDENWGIKITDGRIIESRLVESNSDYLKSNLNTKIVDDKTINFKKVIFDKNDYFTLEVLVLHSRDSDINLIPFGKISGISENQIFKKLDTTRGGILQHILTVDWFFTLYFSFLLIIFGTYVLVKIKKVNKYAEESLNSIKNYLSSYKNSTQESTIMLVDLFNNDKILKVIASNPDLFKKYKDCINKLTLSINEREKLAEKIEKKQYKKPLK
ncbi:MAG: hypothetical protein PHW73_03410 [Atribacterota bacterium]|nr:hypothetical protein [Atribacterota bacterium]